MKLLRPHALLPLGLAALLLPTSCGVVAGAGIGYVISREVLEGPVHQTYFDLEEEQVWALSCESLEILHDVGSELVVDDAQRRVTTEVNGAVVTLRVEANDYQRTLVQVTAEDPLSSDLETGSLVMQNIIDRVQREATARPASAPLPASAPR